MEDSVLVPLDRVRITTLIDNSVDLLLESTELARRVGHMASVPAAFSASGRVEAPLVAEHGFSVLIQMDRGNDSHVALLDAGGSPEGLASNLASLEISADHIEAIVLSHGHPDHVTGMDGLARILRSKEIPILAHPDAWTQRRISVPGAAAFSLPAPSRNAFEIAGFHVLERRTPTVLFDRFLLVTGEVQRTTSFEKGLEGHEALRGNLWTPDPLILDDQAVALHVRDRGLVVITGCGHSGIINILQQVSTLTARTRISAIIGGLHLSTPQALAAMPSLIASLESYRPETVVPSHCTGWEATTLLTQALPTRVLRNSVGTTFDFHA